jgi:hypothetical protein
MNYQEGCEELGFQVRKEVTFGGNQHVAIARCECSVTERIVLTKAMPPAAVLRKFEQRGWAVKHGRIHLCPSCKQATRKTMTKSQSTNGAAAPAPTAAISTRLIFALLEEHFDDRAGRYHNGYSDEKVAAETQAAIERVRAIRKEHFGDLRAPAELEQLRQDVESLQQMIGELRGRVDRALSLYSK